MDRTFFPVTGACGRERSCALLIALVLVGAACRAEEPPIKPVPPGSADSLPGARPRAPGGIVAVVNDDVITQAELDLWVQRQRAGLERLNSPAVVERELPRIQWMLLERMIENRLVLQLVKKEEQKAGRPYVTEADVDEEIKDELKNLQDQGLPISSTEELFRFWRERDGVEREDLRRFIKELLAVRFYLQRNVFTPNAFVSPQELRSYYFKHVKEFTTPVAVSFRQIKVPRSHPEAELIVGLVEKGLKEAVDFCELAKKFDEAALQGDLESACRLWTKTFKELEGWHKPIPDVLRKTEKGKTSDRVVTAVGIHYLKVEDVIEGTPKPFSEAQEEITRRIRMERNQEQMTQFFSRLVKRARIEKYLSPPPPEAPAAPRSLPAKDAPPRGPPAEAKQAPPPEGGGGER
jgi:hypothetical protein